MCCSFLICVETKYPHNLNAMSIEAHHTVVLLNSVQHHVVPTAVLMEMKKGGLSESLSYSI